MNTSYLLPDNLIRIVLLKLYELMLACIAIQQSKFTVRDLWTVKINLQRVHALWTSENRADSLFLDTNTKSIHRCFDVHGELGKWNTWMMCIYLHRQSNDYVLCCLISLQRSKWEFNYFEITKLFEALGY